MVDQARGLALAERVDQHVIEDRPDQLGVVVADQHLHNLQQRANHHNALARQAVAEEVDLGYMVDYSDGQGYGDHGQCGDGYQGGRSFPQLVEEHTVQPAYLLGQLQLDHHFEMHKQKLQGPQISQRAVQRGCCRRNMLQYERHQLHQGQQVIAQWREVNMNQKR